MNMESFDFERKSTFNLQFIKTQISSHTKQLKTWCIYWSRLILAAGILLCKCVLHTKLLHDVTVIFIEHLKTFIFPVSCLKPEKAFFQSGYVGICKIIELSVK